MDADLHALLAQRQRERAPYALAGASYERNAPGKIHECPTGCMRDKTSASCFSSQLYGIIIAPIIRGPSAEPCQSEPPLGTSLKKSDNAASRFMSSSR